MHLALDPDACYEIIKARDARFDGLVYVGVSTTGIYCRPVCTVRTPGRDRCAFFTGAAQAEAAGYRPCLRCRPELAPGSAPIDAVSRLAVQAAARIDAGALDDEGNLEELADEFGISARQLRRVMEREFGVSPVALAQTRRLLLAKQLLTDTRMRIVDVAFASGFSSLRQFNRLFRERYRLRPSALRKNGARPAGSRESITLKLDYRAPFAWSEFLNFINARGSERIETHTGRRYIRNVRLGKHAGWFAAEPAPRTNVMFVEVSESLGSVLPELLLRLRHFFDLSASPLVIADCLGRHKKLAPLVKRVPGLRIPGTLDGFELALRAVLGQQISVRAATTIYGRFVHAFSPACNSAALRGVDGLDGLDRLTPAADRIANARLPALIELGLTKKRAETVRLLARAVASGELRLTPICSDLSRTRETLRAIPGIGPWTTEYIAMRALGDPDAFPASDLGLLRALKLQRPARLLAMAEDWRPWRAYAAMYLWTSGQGG